MCNVTTAHKLLFVKHVQIQKSSCNCEQMWKLPFRLCTYLRAQLKSFLLNPLLRSSLSLWAILFKCFKLGSYFSALRMLGCDHEDFIFSSAQIKGPSLCVSPLHVISPVTNGFRKCIFKPLNWSFWAKCVVIGWSEDVWYRALSEYKDWWRLFIKTKHKFKLRWVNEENYVTF